MSDQAYGRQIPLDGQGGKIGDNPQDDISHLREGGQTDYGDTYKAGREPFDQVSLDRRKYETRFIDMDLQPVPIACQEDRSLVIYDYVQKQYNVGLSGGATAGTFVLDITETGWVWLPTRVGLFGTATGFMSLHDGASLGDNSTAFAVQAGTATLLGNVQSIGGELMLSSGSPLTLKLTGVDANAQIAVGFWYRKAKWVWTPPKFIQDDALKSDMVANRTT